MDNVTHRDPELIRREIMIADLSATNCALQADSIYRQIDLLQRNAKDLQAPHHEHVARKAALEAELKAAEAAKVVAPLADETAPPL